MIAYLKNLFKPQFEMHIIVWKFEKTFSEYYIRDNVSNKRSISCDVMSETIDKCKIYGFVNDDDFTDKDDKVTTSIKISARNHIDDFYIQNRRINDFAI